MFQPFCDKMYKFHHWENFSQNTWSSSYFKYKWVFVEESVSLGNFVILANWRMTQVGYTEVHKPEEPYVQTFPVANFVEYRFWIFGQVSKFKNNFISKHLFLSTFHKRYVNAMMGKSAPINTCFPPMSQFLSGYRR